MADGFDSQIHIELGPVEVVRLRTFDVRELRDRSVLEPGKFRKRHKQLLRLQHHPEAVSRNVRHLNVESACARQHGCHVRVSGSAPRPPEFGGRSGHNSAPVRSAAQARTRFAVCAMHVDMHARFLAREEKEPESSLAKDRRTQGSRPAVYSAWMFARLTMSRMRASPSRVHRVSVAGSEPTGSRP